MIKSIKATCYVCEFCHTQSPLGANSQETEQLSVSAGWGTWGIPQKGNPEKVILRALCPLCWGKVKNSCLRT